MVLSEARGLWLFLVFRGGITVMGDSVPKHTGPISSTDTPLEPSISRTRPPIVRGNSRDGKPASPERLKRHLPRQLFGVETHSFLPYR